MHSGWRSYLTDRLPYTDTAIMSVFAILCIGHWPKSIEFIAQL